MDTSCTRLAPIPESTVRSANVGPFTVRWHEYGAAAERTTLLLHGVYAGASGYEWRRLAPLLARDRRVVVPDLVGFGMSDRPDLEWTSSIFTSIVAGTVEAIASEYARVGAFDVVASSLTAAHVVRALAATVAPPALALITPTGLGKTQTESSGTVGRLFYDIGRHTRVGDAVVFALSSAPSVRWFERNMTYADPDALTEEEVVETRRVARLPNAKHAQLAFVTNRLGIRLEPDEIRRLAPTVIWGSGQSYVDPGDPDRWTEAGARVTVVADGLPQVESPEATKDLLDRG